MLQFSPHPLAQYAHPIDQTNAADMVAALDFSLFGAMSAVETVVPKMRKRGRGTLLFVNGTTAVRPVAARATTAIGFAAQSAYASMLHDACGADPIYVGQMIIAGATLPCDPASDPDLLADGLWRVHIERTVFRTFAGD